MIYKIFYLIYVFLIISLCLIFTTIALVFYLWGKVDFALIIENAHMVQSVPLLHYWKEIVCGLFLMISFSCFLIRYRKLGCFCLMSVFFALLYQLKEDVPETFLYSKYYMVPDSVQLKDQPKNIIVVSLESMTNLWTFEDVIRTKEPIIPHLLQLQKEGISFNGWKPMVFMLPTIPSYTSILCGVTRPSHVGSITEALWQDEAYGGYPKATCISDILHKNGYRTFYVMGGTIQEERADNLTLFHSFDVAYGKKELLKAGYGLKEKEAGFGAQGHYIPDSVLFQFVKDTLTQHQDKPFFMSVILSNTHGPDHGYVEPFCDKKYDGDIRDAYRCIDQIVFDFVKWCKEQPFFKNTVIYLVGDHTPWDKQIANTGLVYLATYKYPKEHIYNVVIDGGNPKYQVIDKEFSQIDWAPTILESAGFIIEPRRIGLGVSLWSNEETLIEEFGKQKLDEMLKGSIDDYHQILYGDKKIKQIEEMK